MGWAKYAEDDYEIYLERMSYKGGDFYESTPSYNATWQKETIKSEEKQLCQPRYW